MRKILKILAIILVGLGVALVVIYFLIPGQAQETTRFGVTFSTKRADNLGLNWKEVYIAMLDDLRVKNVRLPVYWDDLEPEKDEYHFEDLDWLVSRAARSGANLILVIGRKQPRWPECFVPSWAENLDPKEQEEEILEMIEKVVLRYKKEPAITSWQVENEFFVPFGICPKAVARFLDEELTHIRALDQRPIILTDGGRGSFWFESGKRADILGISVYRVNTVKIFGQKILLDSTKIIPAGFYRKKAWLIEALFPRLEDIFIAELQSEPWIEKEISGLSLEEQFKTMDINKFKKNIEFAKSIGFSETYLWGVEWWYWLKGRNSSDFWNEARKLFQ